VIAKGLKTGDDVGIEIEISGDDDGVAVDLFNSLTPHKGAARIDGAERVTGSAVYAHDFALEGTAHGRLIRPPSNGAKLVRLDGTRAEQVPGFIKLVQVDDLVGVVAETKEAADRAASFVRARWDESPDDVSDWSMPAALDDRASEPIFLRDDGNALEDLAGAAQVISGTYYAPYVANAQMEPSAASARWNDDGTLTVWCSNRAPFSEQAMLASALGIDAEKNSSDYSRSGRIVRDEVAIGEFGSSDSGA
jgi:nicotinate dehydrogenase subunit B